MLIDDDFGFNPCFGGCSIKSTARLYRRLVYSFVSILVLVDVPLNLLTRNHTYKILLCFNPCFGGCSIKSKMEKSRLQKKVVSILVLVDVPLNPIGFGTITAPAGCFNPCFGGCSIKSFGRLEAVPSCDRVSILVLVDVPLKPCFTHFEMALSMRFQSLFWWMFH